MKRLIPLLMITALACQWSSSTSRSISTPFPSDYIPTAVAMTFEALATSTSIPVTATATPASPTPTITFTPAPYEQYTIDYLRQRSYGGGNIEVVEIIEDKGSFTRYLIRYPSDGLMIYGFANIPKGAGPFPILVVLHGYAKVEDYETLDYTTDATDRLTEAGYIVLHPNLRGYRPSDQGDNLFRVGMAVDVLNLVALIKSGAAPPELTDTALSDQIGLWGHSMGGDIVLRVLTVSSDVRAAVLYASISGDEAKNAALLSSINPNDPQLQAELVTPPGVLENISPIYHYKDIIAPIRLYHGTSDLTVPVTWAVETCNLLSSSGVIINCTYYPNEDHTFRQRVADDFYGTQLEFFRTYLSP